MESLFQRERYYWQSPPMFLGGYFYLPLFNQFDYQIPISFIYLQYRNPPNFDPCNTVPGHIEFDVSICFERVKDGNYCTIAIHVQFYELRRGLLLPTVTEYRYLPIGNSVIDLGDNCGKWYQSSVLDNPMKIIYAITPSKGFSIGPNCDPIDYSVEFSRTFRQVMTYIKDVLAPPLWVFLPNWIGNIDRFLATQDYTCIETSTVVNFSKLLQALGFDGDAPECPCLPFISNPNDRDNDCPEGSDDCDDFEESCPETQVADGGCQVDANSVTALGDGVFYGRVTYTPTAITTYFRQINSETGDVGCNYRTDYLGTFYDCDYRTINVPPNVVSQGSSAILNYFQAVGCGSDCFENDDSRQDDDEIRDDPNEDRPCGLYVIIGITIGIKFEWEEEIPGPEEFRRTVLSLKAWEHSYNIDLPIALTNSQMQILNLINLELELELDFDGISVDFGFSLAIGDVEISNSRLEKSFEISWLALFPQFGPALAALRTSPVSPFASIGLQGIGRHDC